MASRPNGTALKPSSLMSLKEEHHRRIRCLLRSKDLKCHTMIASRENSPRAVGAAVSLVAPPEPHVA